MTLHDPASVSSATCPHRSTARSLETYNIIGFSEKGPVQLRVAYNWRNAYIAQHNLNTLNGQPYSDNLIVAACGEVDTNIQFTLNDHYGRRFGIGVRVKS